MDAQRSAARPESKRRVEHIVCSAMMIAHEITSPKMFFPIDKIEIAGSKTCVILSFSVVVLRRKSGAPFVVTVELAGRKERLIRGDCASGHLLFFPHRRIQSVSDINLLMPKRVAHCQQRTPLGTARAAVSQELWGTAPVRTRCCFSCS